MGFFVSKKQGKVTLDIGEFEGKYKKVLFHGRTPIQGTITFNGKQCYYVPNFVRQGSMFRGRLSLGGKLFNGVFHCVYGKHQVTVKCSYIGEACRAWQSTLFNLSIDYSNGDTFFTNKVQKYRNSYNDHKMHATLTTEKKIYTGEWYLRNFCFFYPCQDYSQLHKYKFTGQVVDVENNTQCQWVNGRPKNGVTRYVCPPHGTYEGDFKDGLKHGQGTFTFKDGRVYTGMFRQDAIHGIGMMWDGNNHVKYEGDFSFGYKQGQGVLTTRHHRFEGHFFHDEKHGPGTLYDKQDNVIYSGMYKFGSLVVRPSAPPLPVTTTETQEEIEGH